MAIISSDRFKTEDIYLDYDFEHVMFRRDHSSGLIFRKFYGEDEWPEPIPFSNRLFNESILYGDEITREQYFKGKEKP